MENRPDLFGPPLKQKVRWRLPTNHLNLMYMLSAGLIMSPKGFGKKYYEDALKDYPGWIPLFADVIPKSAMDAATREVSYLKPCAATLDLASLKGPGTAISLDGNARKIAFPDELDGREAVLLIPAPLPASWIETISFGSRDDRQSCEKEAQGYANVPLKSFRCEVDPRLAGGSIRGAWPINGIGLPDRDESHDAELAAGAMMAMLFQLANMGENGINACRLAFDAEPDVAAAIADPLIRALYDWRETARVPVTGDILSRLFWGAVNTVAASRSRVHGPNPRDGVLAFLDAAKTDLDGRLNAGLTRLSSELRDLSGFADATVTEIFERHSKRFPRVMALFFLREKSADLLELRHPLLAENDYIVAAMIFAARDGWLGLPSDVRDQPGMYPAVSHRMAAMAHRVAKTGIDLGAPPPRCVPLRELFSPGPRGWSANQKEAALQLARESKWGCIRTRVSLGKGDYRLVVDGGGANILIEGEAKKVVSEVDPVRFFESLAETRITGKPDEKIRKMLSR